MGMTKVRGIYTKNRDYDIQDYAEKLIKKANLDKVIYLCGRKRINDVSVSLPHMKIFGLENMSVNRSIDAVLVSDLIDSNTLLILDDVEIIRNYPQSMTRNIINFISPKTDYKIISGNQLIVDSMNDLYAPFAVLSKKILYANHYWCFIEDHKEVSVFGDGKIYGNKDIEYTAMKIKPFIDFDFEPSNELYKALYKVNPVPRAHNISSLYFGDVNE
jgi:hypothetical protein